MTDPVDELLERHGFAGPWEALPATGRINRIYATKDVVLRIATDDAEALDDARTEVVAVPAVVAAGIRTPRLLAWDVDGVVHSIYERVHAPTLGFLDEAAFSRRELWVALGRQIRELHERVVTVDDPRGWLDEPSGGDPRIALDALADRIHPHRRAVLARWLDRLAGPANEPIPPRFLHDDVHPMNVLVPDDPVLIDWGDAGFGDPALELSYIPLRKVPWALDGYGDLPGEAPLARILWNHVDRALDHLGKGQLDRMVELFLFAADAPDRFRRWLP